MTAIVDTGVFFAFYSMRDRHHLDSIALIVHHILDESVNVIKYRISPNAAEAFVRAFIDSGIIKILYTDGEIERNALKLFREHR